MKDYYQGNKILFWPDLASSHYAKSLSWLTNHNICFIPKKANPINVRKARPVEDFWGMLAGMVYECGWEVKSERQLKRRIRQKIKAMDVKVMQNMMERVRGKLRQLEGTGGAFSIL